MRKILVTMIVYSLCGGIYAMGPESVLSPSKIYNWTQIASMSPLQLEREVEDSETYAYNDKSKANFSSIEASALSGGALSQYCMYDALVDLATKNTNGIRRAYYTQAVHFLILSACKGNYWQSEESLNFYLMESKAGVTKESINVDDCETVVETIVSYLTGA